MQSVSSRIWTRVAVFISYEDNDYTTRLLLGMVVWPRLSNPFVFKILEEFVRLILQDIFWVAHIPFVRVAKLKFLARFPVNHPPRPVLPSLVFFLCYLVVFAYSMIDCFVFINTESTSAIFLCLIYSCFDMIGPYSAALCY